MIELTMLPAAEGDALWVRWGPEADRRQILVDLGVAATGRTFRRQLERLPVERRKFDLLVVTHVDTDHIYGVLSGLVDAAPLEGLSFDDVWFNGWTHLKGAAVEPFQGDDSKLLSDARKHVLGTVGESLGGRQGEEFSIWLRSRPWNRAFGGGPVCRPEDTIAEPMVFDHGLRITVLGPTRERLTSLQTKWRADVEAALKKGTLSTADVDEDLVPAVPGLEPMGRRVKPGKPSLNDEADLEALATQDVGEDDSLANGSSIALLLELGDSRIVLGGDAFAPDLVQGLGLVLDPPEVDLFKLPHHGSAKNVSIDLVQSVRCKHWLISTNGVKHYHPDAVAMARIIRFAKPGPPVIWFNEPSEYNSWWDDPEWRSTHGYSTEYGSGEAGITVTVENGSVEPSAPPWSTDAADRRRGPG